MKSFNDLTFANIGKDLVKNKTITEAKILFANRYGVQVIFNGTEYQCVELKTKNDGSVVSVIENGTTLITTDTAKITEFMQEIESIV